MKMPEKYRRPQPLGFPQERGDPFGWFLIPFNGIAIAVQASGGADEVEWEHVSASIDPALNRCPSWEEMCFLKQLFWQPEDCVVQFHPPKSDYVNLAKTCLHLWRYKGVMPRPPKNFVG